MELSARISLHVYVSMHINISKAGNVKARRIFQVTEKKEWCFLTHVKALRSWVALLIPLAASELHELDVQLVQNAPLHRVHRVCELWTEGPGRSS